MMTEEAADGKQDTKSMEAVKFIPENEGKPTVVPICLDKDKSTFAGLTKEELMKYANDPFWVRLRWILFVLFWIVWLLMLFGAIFIVIKYPACTKAKENQSVTICIENVASAAKAATMNSSSDDLLIIKMLKDRIDYLKDVGVELYILRNVFQTNEGTFDEVSNFTNVNYYLNSTEDFKKNVIDYAKSKGIDIILSFSPNYSGKNEIFIKSAQNEDKYKDFYVWFPKNYSAKPDRPPNNWLSVYNGSAWEWHEGRKQFYLHQFKETQPDFNFRNPDVIGFFNSVFKYWLGIGIKGFHLENSEYLVENSTFLDEQRSRVHGASFNEYNFNSHYHTRDLKETEEILRNWSYIIKNGSGILSVTGGVLDNFTIADFILRPVTFPSNFNAAELKNIVEKWINNVKRPVWEWICSGVNKSACFVPEATDGLTIISFLLPGTPLIRHGQEVISNNISEESLSEDQFKKLKDLALQDPESRLNIIKKLIELRKLPAFDQGTYNSTVLNENVFVFIRIKSGSPGYVVAWNLGNDKITVNLNRLYDIIPDEIIVALKSGHVFKDIYPLKSRVPSSNIIISPKLAIVFSFVPKAK